MAVSKLLFFSFFFALVFSTVWPDESIEADAQVLGSDAADSSALKIELDQLKFKIHDLESRVNEKTQELKSKDDLISQKEKIIQENSDSIVSLQNEISSLLKKGKLDTAEQVGKAHARAGELEKQVDKLKKELETQQRQKDALEAKASEAEKKIGELNLKLEKMKETNVILILQLQEVSDEQKNKLRKTERALKVAEEEMVKAKLEASSKTQELNEVHGAWLPPWLAVHVVHCQTHWNEHGKPAMDLFFAKAVEKKAHAKKWAKPYLETIKTEAKKFSKPYIDHVAMKTKPHVDKVRVVLKPYTKQAVHAYGKFLESATTYHHQVQGTVQETLNKHELTKPLATQELIWFTASALLALPIIILSRISSAVFCKKANRPTNANTSRSRRKSKRGYPDK
ncbi:uncharacterized protein LOC110603713 isoform X6 [Manihot esculenta]|uniref:uncharacterized protein LOC110603713 isoform X6 n=1 Tax=Manihot esculenta TaxID=3983 RepID=UPI001CC4B16B|nr:uncharacterized protein LOC110603713 isoform X6 [Manihot esculenta]